MGWRFAIVIERTGSGFSAYAPDLPGCVTAGATVDEVKRSMAEAISFHLDGLREDGLPIAEPSTECDYVAVDEPRAA